MAQWERIVALHEVFKSSRSYRTYEDLMREVGCSRATLFRLLSHLENRFRAPLERSRRYGGCRYSPGSISWELPALWIDNEEIEALACIEHILEGLGDGFLGEALRPVRNRIEPFLRSRKVNPGDFYKKIRIIAIGNRKVDASVFEAIAEALLHTRRIRITYCKYGESDGTDREISPQTLLRYRDNWYCDAFCHSAGHMRTFALNRIVKTEIVNTRALIIPRDELDKLFGASYGIFSGPARSVAHIRFTGPAAIEVPREKWHPDQECIEQPETGSCVLKVPYDDSRELVMDILRWGDQAEVLEPEELRKEVAGIVDKMGRVYKI